MSDLEKQGESELQVVQIDEETQGNKGTTASTKESWKSRFTQQGVLNVVTGIAFLIAAIIGLTTLRGNKDDDQNAAPAINVGADVEADRNGAFSVPTNNGKVLNLNRIINQEDQSVTVQLDYEGLGWMAFAFSEATQMVPNVAVIGLPDDGTVSKYNLGGKDVSLVTPLEEDLQSLTDASITQNATHTVLTFTKPLIEDNEPAVTVGDNLFIWAVGDSNTLAYHGPNNRGSSTAAFDGDEGVEVDDTPPAAAPPVAPLECATQSAFSVSAGDGKAVNLNRIINQGDQTVTVQLDYEGLGWMAFAFSEAAQMVPNVAVIGLPDDGTVSKYNLGGKDVSLVTPLEEDLQSLTDASITQNATHTVLTFTKPLIEDNEPAVTVGDNLFIWAVGDSNTLAYHGPNNRGSSTAVFDECVEEVDETPAPVAAAPVAPPSEAPVTSSPTVGVIVTEPPTSAPVAVDGGMAGTFSKRGNRQSCSIDYCPSDGFQAQVSGTGCTCENGLNSCVWDGDPATVEFFEEVTLRPTNADNIFLLEGTGNQLNLGEGGDDASGIDCFDDPLRGGFRVDLTLTQFQISIQSTVTVSGFSPAMKVVADGVTVGEVRQYGAQAELSVEIPTGTRDLQVSCGGWPADCTSTIYVAPW